MNALFALAAAAGVAYGWLGLGRRPGAIWAPLLRAVWKMLPVALLAIAALVAGAPPLLVAALALATLGDGLLALDGQRSFLAGLVAFLLCHLAYAAVFFADQNAQWSAGMAFLAGTVAIFAGVISAYRYLRPALGGLRWPVAVYCGAIAAMAVAAWSQGPNPVLISGVALFMASDLALAVAKFRLAKESPWQPAFERFVWFAYLAAQLLIAGNFLFAS